MPRTDRMYVCCRDCTHVWIAMHLPMEMKKASKILKNLYCPACGAGSKTVVMASKEQAMAFEAMT